MRKWREFEDNVFHSISTSSESWDVGLEPWQRLRSESGMDHYFSLSAKRALHEDWYDYLFTLSLHGIREILTLKGSELGTAHHKASAPLWIGTFVSSFGGGSLPFCSGD
jgi:hypothetical protein